jgi:hypothetical protein
MKILLFIAIVGMTLPVHAEWLIKQYADNGGKVLEIKSAQPSEIKISGDTFLKRNTVQFISETEKLKVPQRMYQELIVSDDYFQKNIEKYGTKAQRMSPSWPGSEVRTIVDQGPSSNRIDLTIVGDGYTAQEKDKFFADALRITNDMFKGQTFASYLPLFNVHAVFVPSNESGLSDVTQKDTALGLSRSPVGSKRAIMPGNTSAIDRAIALSPATDYSILIANDDFYGGLGGEYAISTRSVESGTVVLRHELGHNFGQVGEEYDGGQVYSGANHSSSSNVPWKNWLKNGKLEVYESKFLSGNYLWKNLKSGSFKTTFNFPGQDYVYDIDISSVGWETPQDVEVRLDGEVKELAGVWTADRSFFKFKNQETLSAGQHTIEIKEVIKDGDNVLAFADIYAHPANMNKDHQFIGAYNTFYGPGQGSGYRPTYDTCLMRDMRSVDFCSVDKENMWRRFLSVVKLVDSYQIEIMSGMDHLHLITPALTNLKINVLKNENGSWKLIHSSTGTEYVMLPSKGQYKLDAIFTHPEIMGGSGEINQSFTFNN